MPQRSHGWFRTWFRKVWDVRGGGLYACGFAAAFLWYEFTSLADDVADIGMLWNGQAIDFLVNIAVDSFKNTMRAFMWPVHIVRIAPPWGAVGLGLAFWLFPIYVKPHIERWLFDDDEVRAAS